MRHSRSLLEVHGISHSVLQKHPHPDACSPDELSAGQPPTFENRNFETIFHDRNFSKRTPSLQTVFSYQTDSSCSWSEENDKESTEKVRQKLQKCDDILYNESKNSAHHLTEDDTMWKTNFQYLRVIGERIEPTMDILQNENPPVLDGPSEEEIIEQDGVYEENVFDDSTSSDSSQENSVQAREIKNRVLEKLTDHLMSKVAEWLAALGESRRKPTISRIHSSLTRLPPLTMANSPPSRRSPVLRPLTSLQQKRRITVLREKPLGSETYLQGLLTISSKVLQDRFKTKLANEWYREILTTPQSLEPLPEKHNSPNSVVTNTMKPEDWVRLENLEIQHRDEVENNSSLPNIHRKTSLSHSQTPSQLHIKTGPEIAHQSLPIHAQRSSITKNLPSLRHNSAVRLSTKRIASALPTRSKGTKQPPANPRFRHVTDYQKDINLRVPESHNLHGYVHENTQKRIVLSPFTLLPIVKSLTPLASAFRPKSKLDKRK